MTKYAASMDDVIAASKRIEGHGHRTPILTNKTIDECLSIAKQSIDSGSALNCLKKIQLLSK